MIEHEGDTALAPRVHSQDGGGTYINYYSTLTVANGSSIDGNTADVSLPVFALAFGLVVGSPSEQSTLERCERDTSR